MANGENAKTQEEDAKKQIEDNKQKKEHENKEKALSIVHKHFMGLLFEVLTAFTKDLKADIIDP
jgi:hypothetical protein